MHHFMLACVPLVGLPQVGHRVPGTHLVGLREPLRPYVRDPSHGWLGRESQERG